jgi:hypothetical protein
MWHHLAAIIDAITNWSPQTFAAIASAGIALWAARSGLKERALALGRQVVVDINTSCTLWSIEAGRFLGLVHSQSKADDISPELVNGPDGLERFTRACTDTDRVLKAARMACNDFQLQVRVAEAEMHLVAFLKALEPESRARLTETPRERLARIFLTGRRSVGGFNQATEAFLARGFKFYAPRRSCRYWLAERRFQRAAAAEAAQTPRRQVELPE